METKFKCNECKMDIAHNDTITTGYGVDKAGNKVCFGCCAKHDLNELLNLNHGKKFYMYLTKQEYNAPCGAKYKKWFVSNWPNSLKIPCVHVTNGRHNFSGKRIDAWFYIGDKKYWAFNFSPDNQDCCTIKRVKNTTKS